MNINNIIIECGEGERSWQEEILLDDGAEGIESLVGRVWHYSPIKKSFAKLKPCS